MTANDLRYGHQGGRWIPNRPVKEHRPHLFKDVHCPAQGCRGRIRNQPLTTPMGPYTIGPCDGLLTQHTFDCIPLDHCTTGGTP